jgi:hypothetical protein
MAVGTLAMVYDITHSSDEDDAMRDAPRLGNGFWAGIGASVVGGGFILVGHYHYLPKERQNRRAAFATYADGLREQLALCVDGMRVIACQ